MVFCHRFFAVSLLILAGVSTASAETFSLDLNLASVHTERWARKSLNQQNPGAGMTVSSTQNLSVSFGGYYNSYRRTSLYAIANWTPLHLPLIGGWSVAAGATAALVTGYRRAEVPSAPFAAAALVRVIAPDKISLNLNVVPNGGARSTGFIGAQVSLPL